jgi:nitrite reductase/ring-hydroxylating ferredoxin subunit
MDTNATAAPEQVLVCAQTDVPADGTVITRAVHGETIAIARRSATDQAIVAFESKCPHFQGPLRFGRVVNAEVICPWHFMRFDTATGQASACDKSVMKLRVFPVEIVEGNVYVRIEANALLESSPANQQG